MKTKIMIKEGVQKLVIADEEINKQSQYGSPIVLAVIINYFDTGNWSFEDYRLKEYLIPSGHLSDSNQTIANFKEYSVEDKKLVLSKLHEYQLNNNGGLFYSIYDTIDLAGDIPKDDPKMKSLPKCACFTFKEAKNKLREAKEFWNNYEGSLTDEKLKIPNENRQPDLSKFYTELSWNKDTPKKKRI